MLESALAPPAFPPRAARDGMAREAAHQVLSDTRPNVVSPDQPRKRRSVARSGEVHCSRQPGSHRQPSYRSVPVVPPPSGDCRVDGGVSSG
jgi:hypothetical protein